MTVPSELPIVFNYDGTNTYPTNWRITNNSTLAGVHLESVYLSASNSGWHLLGENEDVKAEKEESIYKSKKIAPGYEMNCIELNRELEKGRHECTIEIKYAVEGHVSTVFPIVIEVE